MDLGGGGFDAGEPGGEVSLLGLRALPGQGDEPGGNRCGDRADQGDADQHERDRDQPAGAGHQDGIVVADRGDGDRRPPQRVAEGGDVRVRGIPFGVERGQRRDQDQQTGSGGDGRGGAQQR